MYYGNSTVSSGQSVSDVWDDDYVGVWHMNASNPLDSTQYANNGNANSGSNNDTGRIAKGNDFDTNNFINVGNETELDITAAITIEAWVNMDAAESYPSVVTKSSAGKYQYLFEFAVATRQMNLYMETANPSWATQMTNASTLNSWEYIVATDDSSTLKYYFNGGFDSSPSVSGGAMVSNVANVSIGKRHDGYGFNGVLDEVRISNTTRSLDWINQSYQLVENQAGYVTFSEEDNDDGQESAVKQITVRETKRYIAGSHCHVHSQFGFDSLDALNSYQPCLDIGSNGKG